MGSQLKFSLLWQACHLCRGPTLFFGLFCVQQFRFLHGWFVIFVLDAARPISPKIQRMHAHHHKTKFHKTNPLWPRPGAAHQKRQQTPTGARGTWDFLFSAAFQPHPRLLLLGLDLVRFDSIRRAPFKSCQSLIISRTPSCGIVSVRCERFHEITKRAAPRSSRWPRSCAQASCTRACCGVDE